MWPTFDQCVIQMSNLNWLILGQLSRLWPRCIIVICFQCNPFPILMGPIKIRSGTLTKCHVFSFLYLITSPCLILPYCGQLWVWHMICDQTCDGLYHFAFYLVNFGIPTFGSLVVRLYSEIDHTYILAQNFLQHSRLYSWNGNVRIYSNNMQF